MGLNGVLVSGNGCFSDFAAKRKWCGSSDDELWKYPSNFDKLSGDFSENQQNMLSFSTPKFDAFSSKEINGELGTKNLLQNPTFQNFQHSNSCYSRYAGYSSCNNGSMNATSMYFMNGVKGAFTASQWFELEQQALIFKYILANEPIPPNLLVPIRRAFELAGFSGFPAGLFRPNLFGWGPFHLGLASSTDPEVGRCRRTDGKKWRCSRDAVPDQKYCERHINRGRHRSRKPVEGHTGHPISGGTTNKISNSNTSTTNIMNMTSSSALVVPGGGPANSFAINLSQSKDLQSQPVTSSHLSSSLAHRSMVDKPNSTQRMQNTAGLDFLPPRINEDSRATKHTFSIAESAAADFPFLTSDATILSIAQGCSYQPYASRTCVQSHDSPRILMENDPASILWPKFSISIPPADFMSSTSSPTKERKALSPLSREFEPDKMQIGSNLGSNTVSNEPSPISWETSLGGPLGEVLKTTMSNSSGNENKSVSAINLLSNAAEGSPQLASSPTGVLQRTAFSYLSNSSAGSSPRAENGRILESGTLSGDLIGFTLGSSSSLSRCN